jgi:hypothetical protein
MTRCKPSDRPGAGFAIALAGEEAAKLDQAQLLLIGYGPGEMQIQITGLVRYRRRTL